MRTVAFCEVDEFCRAVLRKHWPGVPIFGDIRELDADGLDRIGPVDLVCGGFPCQPFSVAGKQKAHADDRYLWPEMRRVIALARPTWVICENVVGIITLALDDVLADLEGLGYAARPFVIPACAVGAPHRRDRVWIIARDAHGEGQSARAQYASEVAELRSAIADAGSKHEQGKLPSLSDAPRRTRSIEGSPGSCSDGGRWWSTEPDVGGGIDGFPSWLHRFVGWGMTYEESYRSVEALRSLWNTNVSQALWKAIGGLDCFQQAQVLFAFVRKHQKDANQARLLLESQEAFEAFVRSVWGAAAATSSSRRSKQSEQQTREHPDLVQVVSRLFARNGKTPWSRDSWEDGIPRVAQGTPRRAHRLRALGNAVVPQVVEEIGRAIMLTAHKSKEVI